MVVSVVFLLDSGFALSISVELRNWRIYGDYVLVSEIVDIVETVCIYLL